MNPEIKYGYNAEQLMNSTGLQYDLLPETPLNGADSFGPSVIAIDSGLRNAWQWLAMVTMLLDHLGYLYYQLDAFRYIGRLAMPLYAMLFVMSIQSGRVNHKRLLIIALISQILCVLIFNDMLVFEGMELKEFRLNIILGFYIFYWLTEAVKRRSLLLMMVVFGAMFIPVSYDWYLYASLAVFYWLDGKPAINRIGFGILTTIYTVFTNSFLRQLLGIISPFLKGITAPRPPKYLYRYFYPGHLLVLVIIDFFIMGAIHTPFGTFPKPADDDSQWNNEYYDEYYDDYRPVDTLLPVRNIGPPGNLQSGILWMIR